MPDVRREPIVQVCWQTAPERSGDRWFRTYTPTELPLHIAEAEQEAGRCNIIHQHGGPIITGHQDFPAAS